MDIDEVISDIIRIRMEQEMDITPDEVAADVSEILFDRGLISEAEIELAHHQAAEAVRGAGYSD